MKVAGKSQSAVSRHRLETKLDYDQAVSLDHEREGNEAGDLLNKLGNSLRHEWYLIIESWRQVV